MDVKIGTRTFSESMAGQKPPNEIRKKKEYFEDVVKLEPAALNYEETVGLNSYELVENAFFFDVFLSFTNTVQI